MNLRTIIERTIKRLKRQSIATAGLDALIIARNALAKDDVFILTHPEYELTQEEIEKIERLTSKREDFYPTAYLSGKKEFYGFEFYVDENVLIPRPETEMIVDEAMKLSKQFKSPTIVDVGTGSGAIAITLSKKLKTTVIASDISFDALQVAYRNITMLNAKVELVAADTLSFIKSKVDIIVSNPPYIDEKEYDLLPNDVKYEPRRALVCEKGTKVIKKLIEQAKNKCSYLVLEIGYNQENFVKSFSSCAYVKADLSGLPRLAVFNF